MSAGCCSSITFEFYHEKHHLRLAMCIGNLPAFSFSGSQDTPHGSPWDQVIFLSFRTIGLVPSNNTMYGHHHQVKLQEHFVLRIFSCLFHFFEVVKFMSSVVAIPQAISTTQRLYTWHQRVFSIWKWREDNETQADASFHFALGMDSRPSRGRLARRCTEMHRIYFKTSQEDSADSGRQVAVLSGPGSWCHQLCRLLGLHPGHCGG